MECNKEEKVGRRTMRINGRYIRGFICPKFLEEEPTKAVVPEAKKKADVANNTFEPTKSDTDLAVEVWYGTHGSGDKRRAALGNRYDQVQKSVGAIGQSVSTFVSANRDYLKKWGCDALLK